MSSDIKDYIKQRLTQEIAKRRREEAQALYEAEHKNPVMKGSGFSGAGYSGGAIGDHAPIVAELMGYGVPLEVIQRMAKEGNPQFSKARKVLDEMDYSVYHTKKKKGERREPKQKRPPTEYQKFMGEKMRAGVPMKKAVAMWNKKKEKKLTHLPKKLSEDERLETMAERIPELRRSTRPRKAAGSGRPKRKPSARNIAIGKLRRQGMSMAEANAYYKEHMA